MSPVAAVTLAIAAGFMLALLLLRMGTKAVDIRCGNPKCNRMLVRALLQKNIDVIVVVFCQHCTARLHLDDDMQPLNELLAQVFAGVDVETMEILLNALPTREQKCALLTTYKMVMKP